MTVEGCVYIEQIVIIIPLSPMQLPPGSSWYPSWQEHLYPLSPSKSVQICSHGDSSHSLISVRVGQVVCMYVLAGPPPKVVYNAWTILITAVTINIINVECSLYFYTVIYHRVNVRPPYTFIRYVLEQSIPLDASSKPGKQPHVSTPDNLTHDWAQLLLASHIAIGSTAE